ncbi:hypothetical protein HMPREF9575_01343 [Cutibacterium acnes HL110PA1]|nr:hypothetical protein HMPREF9575_01343 [Cutibacterium acnes HL110PA1]
MPTGSQGELLDITQFKIPHRASYELASHLGRNPPATTESGSASFPQSPRLLRSIPTTMPVGTFPKDH